MQPGVRDGFGGRHRAGVPYPASWRDRFAGHPVERIAFVLAKRPECKEDIVLIKLHSTQKIKAIYERGDDGLYYCKRGIL